MPVHNRNLFHSAALVVLSYNMDESERLVVRVCPSVGIESGMVSSIAKYAYWEPRTIKFGTVSASNRC